MRPERILTELGYDGFRPGQLEAIDMVMQGQQLLVLLPTGYGKSLIYRTISKLIDGVTFVISPLISLMKDQVDFTMKFDPRWGTSINSSLDPSERRERIWKAANGFYKMIYIAPERLRTAEFAAMMEHLAPEMLVVDEAHCVNLWGHDFRPDYLLIKRFRPKFKRFMALTATASKRSVRELIDDLGGELRIHRPVPVVRTNFNFEIFETESVERKLLLLSRIMKRDYGSGIIYTTTRQEADFVADFLRELGLKATSYHAGLGPEQRSSRQDAFMRGDVRFVAATTAFGMGIDKPDIDMILHWSIPESVEAYYQEIGRGGRDGRPVDAILFFSEDDVERREAMIKAAMPSPETVNSMFNWIVKNGKWFNDEILFDPEAILHVTDYDPTMLRIAMSIMEAAGAVEWKESVTSRLMVSERGSSHEVNILERAAATGESPFEIEKEIWLAHFQEDLNLKQTGQSLMRVSWKSYVMADAFAEIIDRITKAKLDRLQDMTKLVNFARHSSPLTYLKDYFNETTKPVPPEDGINPIVVDQAFKMRPRPSVFPDFNSAPLPPTGSGSRLDAVRRLVSRVTGFLAHLLGTQSHEGGASIRKRVQRAEAHHRQPLNRKVHGSRLDRAPHSIRYAISRIKDRRRRLSKHCFSIKELGFVRDFMRREHPTELGSRLFHGYIIDYKYTFSAEQGRVFSNTYKALMKLRSCRSLWSRDYFAMRVRELLNRFDEKGVLVPVRRGESDCDVLKLIIESVSRETDWPSEELSQLRKGDFAVLLFDEFDESRGTMELLERAHRVTGRTPGVIGLVYRR